MYTKLDDIVRDNFAADLYYTTDHNGNNLRIGEVALYKYSFQSRLKRWSVDFEEVRLDDRLSGASV